LNLVCKIHSAFPQVADLIYTSPSEEGWACETLRAGAAAFLPKNASERELVIAIQKIAADGIYLTETQMEFLALRNLRNANSKPWWELLSSREKAIIQLIAAGNTIKEIANELGLSSSTVATYRARMLQKLGVKSDADLVRIVDGQVCTVGNGGPSGRTQGLSDAHSGTTIGRA
jgi:DNA-binding NarL/FixJ family response regulator